MGQEGLRKKKAVSLLNENSWRSSLLYETTADQV